LKVDAIAVRLVSSSAHRKGLRNGLCGPVSAAFAAGMERALPLIQTPQ
jgi:hypothetical protein